MPQNKHFVILILLFISAESIDLNQRCLGSSGDFDNDYDW